MKLSSPDGETLDFWSDSLLPKKPKSIGLSLSGGTDSTILFVMLCDYFKNDSVKIYPITQEEPHVQTNVPTVRSIIEKVQNMYPEQYIHDLDVFYGPKDPKAPKSFWEVDFINSHSIEVFVNGMTLAPLNSISPIDPNYEKEHTKEFKIRSRDSIKMLNYISIQPEGYIRYNPFKQVTKMFIKHLYNHFNLLDTLFPITTSCTRLYIKENITTPCKQCFWYQEKYWAFGCYDWEVPQKTPQGYIKWER